MKEKFLYVYQWGFWGGIHSGVLAISKEFPEYDHYALQLNSNSNDTTTDNYLRKNGIVLKKLNGLLLKREVEALNPKIIFLFTIQSKHIERPIQWLENYYTVKFHNSSSKKDIESVEVINVNINWFVSEYVFSKQTLKHENIIISPPVMFIKNYLNIERPKRQPVVGRIQAFSHIRKGKYPKTYLSILEKISNSKFLIGDSRKNPPNPEKMRDYLKEVDIFILWADNKETFSRVIAEANLSGIPVVLKNNNDGASEQIKKSGGGVLVDTEEEFIGAIELLTKNKKLRDELANRGKYWCVENCSTKLLRACLHDYLVGFQQKIVFSLNILKKREKN